MLLNPKGFWRLLVLLFGFYALGVAAVAAVEVRAGLRCTENLDRRISEARASKDDWVSVASRGRRSSSADKGPAKYFYVDSVKFPTDMSDGEIAEKFIATKCQSIGGKLGLGVVAALVGGFVVLFGSALAVRWVYRGFASPRAN